MLCLFGNDGLEMLVGDLNSFYKIIDFRIFFCSDGEIEEENSLDM